MLGILNQERGKPRLGRQRDVVCGWLEARRDKTDGVLCFCNLEVVDKMYSHYDLGFFRWTESMMTEWWLCWQCKVVIQRS